MSWPTFSPYKYAVSLRNMPHYASKWRVNAVSCWHVGLVLIVDSMTSTWPDFLITSTLLKQKKGFFTSIKYCQTVFLDKRLKWANSKSLHVSLCIKAWNVLTSVYSRFFQFILYQSLKPFVKWFRFYLNLWYDTGYAMIINYQCLVGQRCLKEQCC